METYILITWVMVAGAKGEFVDLESRRDDFFSKKQCEIAKQVTLRETAGAEGFRRVVAYCMDRPLPDQEKVDFNSTDGKRALK